MTTCAIIGDCIAMGLALLNPACDANAVVGRSAATIARQHVAGQHDWAVISAGSNLPGDRMLTAHLRTIRGRLHATRVVWIVPRNRRAARLVRQTATGFGDATVSFSRVARDGVHPRSYVALSRAVHGRLGE